MSAANVPLLSVDGPLLAFGGPYSNLEATRALLSSAERLGIPPERIICTGDVVAYCADPAETVALVRNAGIHVVMGNCEESLAAGADDCGCGFTPGSSCDRLSAAWYAHADRQLDQDARTWMEGLPRRLDIEIAGRRWSIFGRETVRPARLHPTGRRFPGEIPGSRKLPIEKRKGTQHDAPA